MIGGRKRPGKPAAGVVGRGGAVRLKTAKGRKPSSARWLRRQLKDPYVAEARRRGYRSRAAFKIIELDDRFRFLGPGGRVVDLGAAPGGWTQVAVARVRAGKAGGGHVVALDVAEIEPMPGAVMVRGDFLDPETSALLAEVLGGPADVVLSDMAPAAIGHRATDHYRVVALCEAALAFATAVLAPGGAFVAKVLGGGAEGALVAELRRLFARVKHAKPPSSRADSAEMYVVAQGFRGRGAP